MSAATTTTFLPLQTTNTLDPFQRARLLKSTRELESLLGATSHVLESDSLVLNPPTTTYTAQHRNPLYPSPSAVSSITSLTDSSGSHESLSTNQQLSQNGTKNTQRRWKFMQLRTPVLRLRKVPSIPLLNDGTKPSSSSSSSVGSAPNCAKIPTPHTPINTMEPFPLVAPENDPAWATTKKSQDKTRLKRMTRLIRTLGENISPGLVLSQRRSQVSQDQNPESEPSSRSRFSRQIWPSDAVSLAEPASTLAHDGLQACDRQSNAPLESSDPQASVSRKRWHRSASIGPLSTRVAPTSNKSAVAQKSPSAPGLSRSATTIQCQDTSRGNQTGWDGEWSIKDSVERAMALRNLKCR